MYRSDQDSDNQDSAHAMYAPDVCQGPDGRYYLYYGLDFSGVISVARADRPEGPFEYYGKVRDEEEIHPYFTQEDEDNPYQYIANYSESPL